MSGKYGFTVIMPCDLNWRGFHGSWRMERSEIVPSVIIESRAVLLDNIQRWKQAGTMMLGGISLSDNCTFRL